jgi:hypothetical protein
MKFKTLKLLLCAAALGVAGCSSPQNPYAGSGGFAYMYDMIPPPLPDLTPAELDRLYQVSPSSPGVFVPGAVIQTSGNSGLNVH